MLAKKQVRVTVSEFLDMKFKDNSRHELIDGNMMMSPRPSEKHMIIQSNLITEMNVSFKDFKRDCRAITENQLILDDNTYVIPDIMVKRFKENQIDDEKQRPLILIEVLSPSSMRTDLVDKLNKYKVLGIPEYWIVDTRSKEITIHDFINNDSKRFYCDNSSEETISSIIISELGIDIKDI